MPDESRSPVVVATDLTEHSVPALVRGHAHARALGAPLLVIHVIPDVLRHHPLMPSLRENDAVLAVELEKQAADLVTAQVRRVVDVSPEDFRVIIEIGDAEDEIVRIAEERRARLIAVGAKPRHGIESVIGHVAERVVRYAHTDVLIARPGPSSRRVLVATDLTEASAPALALAALLVKQAGAEVTLLHIVQSPKILPFFPALSALGNAWMPPPRQVVEQVEALGRTALDGLAQEHGFAHVEQLEGDPGHLIAERADALDAALVVLASHGRTGLRRLVLGSTTEKVIRRSTRSVLVSRATPT